MCVANHEKNAGISVRKPRKSTGESQRRDGPISHLPKCSLLISEATFSCQRMNYQPRVHICPQEIINIGESCSGWHSMHINEGKIFPCCAPLLCLNSIMALQICLFPFSERNRAFKCLGQGHRKSEPGG